MIFNNPINVWSKYQYQAITIEFGKKFWKISYWVKSAWRKWPIHFNWKHNLDEIMNFLKDLIQSLRSSLFIEIGERIFALKRWLRFNWIFCLTSLPVGNCRFSQIFNFAYFANFSVLNSFQCDLLSILTKSLFSNAEEFLHIEWREI